MKKTFHSNTAFLDILFNTLLGFVALFFLAFIQMNPKEEENKRNIEAKAEFVITFTWNSEHDDDVDAYVEDPQGHLVMFKRREDGLMHLDRDDLGHRNDIIQSGEETIQYSENQEMITIRGIVEGEYTVNAHMYLKKHPTATTVKITLEKLRPYKKIIEREIILEKLGDEKTAFRFKLNKTGDVVETNELEKKLTTSSFGNNSQF
jgi:hypothetical protein